MISEYLLLFIIFIFSPYLSLCVQNTPPYLGPCVRGTASYRREPRARPCCSVTRGSNCVFWVLSGTKPQYLHPGADTRADQRQEGGKELVFWLHLLQSSCLFFHCPVPRGCTRKDPVYSLRVVPLPSTFPSATRTHVDSRCEVWVPRGSNGRFQCPRGTKQVQDGDTKQCPVVWSRTQRLDMGMTRHGRSRSLRVEVGMRGGLACPRMGIHKHNRQR